MDNFEELLEIDEQKIKTSVRLQIPIEVTTYTLSRNMEVYIHKVMRMFLEECHQEQMNEYITFCLGELLTNSKKANTKRVYFKEEGLDINNIDDYEKGMKDFKQKTLANIDHYLELQRKEGLYIKLVLQFKGDKVKIEIRNNSVITPFELERIHKKLDSVQQYHSLEEVYSKVLDQSEGAGLGIIIISLMLQKIGFSKDDYKVIATDTETITSIVLPCNAIVYNAMSSLGYDYISLQKGIPVFEENFNEAIKIVFDDTEKIDREKLFNCLCKDVTLALVVFKEVAKRNKENFDLYKAINTLTDDELKEIFVEDYSGVDFVQKTEDRKQLWDHSVNVGFYTYNLMKNQKIENALFTAEEMFGLGLLANIGFILIKCTSEFQKQLVQDVCDQYETPVQIQKIFYAGNPSNYISLMFVKSLNFSDNAKAVISCWNNDEFVPEFPLVYLDTVYLAEMIQNYSEKIIDFYQINKDVLKRFAITNEEQFKSIISKMDQMKNYDLSAK